MTRTIAVLTAGLGSPSSTRLLADRLAAAARAELRSREPHVDVEVKVVEVRDHAHDVTDALLSGLTTDTLQAALDDVTGADALVVVTPTFQASYSGLFKAFVDLIGVDALRGMPVLLGATGGSERHSLVVEHALRPLFAYLRAIPTPTAVYAASSDFGVGSDVLDDRVVRGAGELADLMLGGARVRREPPRDGFAEVTPFTDLLARAGVAE